MSGIDRQGSEEPPDVIATLVVGPIERSTLHAYRDASGDSNPLHIDPAAAQAAGFSDVIAHGMLLMAYIGRMLTDQHGPDAIRAFNVRFTATTGVGDTVECTARRLVDDDAIAVQTVARGRVTVAGTVTLAPPGRSGSA